MRGQLVSDVRFADDQDMVAGTEIGLEGLNEQVKRYLLSFFIPLLMCSSRGVGMENEEFFLRAVSPENTLGHRLLLLFDNMLLSNSKN